MKNINAKHYTETIIYSTDRILKSLKSVLTQYINNLDIGITAEQYTVLDTIYCNPDICQRELSKILLKDKSNTTRILKVLENAHLITRKATKRNNRLINSLKITTNGKKIIDDNMKYIKDFLTQMFKNISDDEIDNFHKLLTKINNDLVFNIV